MKIISKKSIVLVWVIAMPLFLIGQNSNKTKRAKERFEKRAYANAIATYEELLENGYNSEEAFKSLGDAYYYIAEYASAAHWYGELVQMDSIEIEPEYLYRYAQTLKSVGNYKDSDQWMLRFQSAKTNDIRAQKFGANLGYLKRIQENSGRYQIENVSFNSAVSDFAPSFYGEDLVFSSARDTGKVVERIHSWNNRPFLNLFRVKGLEGNAFSQVAKLPTSLNKKTHESSAIFTKDGNTVYFTRNNSDKGRFERDGQGVSRLKLYRANLVDGEWKNIQELPFNSDDYSVAHPTLGPDEKQLYFASDMPGSYGASDIFRVTINEDGGYGKPTNLGSGVNTESRETFPFISDENVLYFASDGHPGLGGLDLFATKMEDLDNLYVVNLGKPVNGTQDDFSYIVKDKKGFFTSNREGGQGSDDIYAFSETKALNLKCTTSIRGIVLDKVSLDPLANAKVKLLDTNGNLIAKATSALDGSFKIDGSCKKGAYQVVAEKTDFDSAETQFKIASLMNVTGLQLTLDRSIKEAEAGTELLKFLGLNSVYFDLDESVIRPDAQASLDKLVDYLKQFPNIKVEIQSHTDAKAGKHYNQRLSERRAKATMEYLVEDGIDKDRLTAKGYGESRLTNDCIDWQKCKERQNELNRRSEFVVIE